MSGTLATPTTTPPRTRRAAAPPPVTYVKSTVTLDLDTHQRMIAASTLDGKDRSVWMAEVVRAAVSGVFITDRREAGGPSPADGPETE